MTVETKVAVNSKSTVYSHNNENYKFFLQTIKNFGPLSVAEFMCLALTHERYGYYTQKKALGPQGDFITAPYISQIFAEVLAALVVYSCQQIDCESNFALIDFGTGEGLLLKNIAANMKKIAKNTLEPEFVAIDINKIPVVLSEKHVVFPQNSFLLPEKPCMIIANEFFDALPIHQFCYTHDGWQEVMVGIMQDKLQFILSKTNLTLLPKMLDIKNISHGTIIEISPAAQATVGYIAGHIEKYGGMAVIIDYGYFEKRTISSLHSIKKHKSISVLEDPGNSDISVHVDFGELKNVCMQYNVCCQSMTQGEFLCALGIIERLMILQRTATKKQAMSLQEDVERLISDEYMGKDFKVLIISSLPFNI